MYEEIRRTKEKLDELILSVITNIVEETSKNAVKGSLGPIETYISIMSAVEEEIKLVLTACNMDSNESLDERLMNQIYDLTEPYRQEMEEGIRKFINKGDNLTTLGELLEHNQELEKIVRDIGDYVYYPGDIEIRKK